MNNNYAEKINIRGVNFDNLSAAEAFLRATAMLVSDESGVKSVFTPNSEIVQMCIEHPEMRDVINSADLVVADGVGVIKASKILGTPLSEKVAGVELGEKLLEFASRSGIPVFFLGGKPDIAERAAAAMMKKYPGLRVTGVHDGYFDRSGEENDAVIGDINDSGAKLLYVCFGAPAQEEWVYENKSRLLNVKLCLALGGSLDIYSGKSHRAPKIFIKTGTEWLYRLAHQPSRIGRMAKLPKFYFGTKRVAKKASKAEKKRGAEDEE